jgi:hypothetical protein
MLSTTLARPQSLDWRRVLVLTMTGVILVVAGLELVETTARAIRQGTLAVDIGYWDPLYAQRWLDTGVMYLPHQLAGPYHVTGQDFLFPPIAMYVFIPFLFLPIVIWWIVPAVALVACFRRFRPALWTFPMYAWPFVLIVIKPSFLPLALLGARRRSWWIAAAIVGVAAIPFGSLWLDYVTAIRNSGLPLYYSLLQLPIVLAPLVMWIGRTTPAGRGPVMALETA